MKPTWIVMPVLAGPEMTEDAIADCLAQSVPVRLLIVNQGVDTKFRQRLERIAEEYADRIFLWSHEPPLPSLSATWNRALDFVWEAGGEEALVVNNDVRLHQKTVEVLKLYMADEHALFVSAVGVRADQFNPDDPTGIGSAPDGGRLTHRGGPDFSCYLISKACHEQYRFDEGFVPAYLEDLDYHRRLMLAGESARIFSVNLPFHHLASGSLKAMDAQKRMALEQRITNGSRAHFRKKWGGAANQERFTVPFDAASARDGVTTPELQRQGADRGTAHAASDGGDNTAIPDSTA